MPPSPDDDGSGLRGLERHFEQSMFVAEVACTGHTPDGRPRLVVVPDRATLLANGLTGVRELIRFEFETLAVQHAPPLPWPEVAFTFDPLPRTPGGAIDRDRLKPFTRPHLVLHERRALGASAAALAVHAALAALRPGAARDYDADSNLELDLDLDSLARAALFADLERRAGFAPTTSGLTWDAVFTVGDLVDRLAGLPGAARAGGSPADRPGDSVSAEEDTWRAVLEGPPAEDPYRRELERHKPIQALAFWLVLRGLRAVAWPVLRIDVRGREHLPRSGPALICPNHESFLDAFVVSAALPFRLLRHVFYLGATEYFTTPRMAAVARAINLVPVDADRNLARAMQLGVLGLRRGKVLVVFPEGERSIDGTVRTFRDGSARLAMATGSPVVPVATRGLFALWPRGFAARWRDLRPWRPARVRVTFGPVIPSAPGRGVEDATRVLRDTVLSLWSDQAEK